MPAIFRYRASPYLLLTLTALFWAGNAVVGRALHALLPPATMAFWRWLLALLLILPFVARPMYAHRAVLRAHWPRLAVLGVLGVGGYNTFLYAALQTSTATNGVLINSVTPVLIVLAAWACFGARIALRQVIGIAMSLAGVAMIVGRGDLQVLASFDFSHGDLLLLGAALTWALYTIFLRWRPAGLGTAAFLGLTVMFGTTLLMLPLYLIERAGGREAVWNAATCGGLVYVAVFPSILAYLFWNRGVEQIGAHRAGLFLYLVPVFGVALAVVFLDERLHIFHLAGAALIFCGIYIATGFAAGRDKT